MQFKHSLTTIDLSEVCAREGEVLIRGSVIGRVGFREKLVTECLRVTGRVVEPWLICHIVRHSKNSSNSLRLSL